MSDRPTPHAASTNHGTTPGTVEDQVGEAARAALIRAKVVKPDPETGALRPRKIRGLLAALRPHATGRRALIGGLRSLVRQHREAR